MFDKAKRKSILSTCRTEEVSAENNISENNLKIVVDTDQAGWYIIKARSERAGDRSLKTEQEKKHITNVKFIYVRK